MVNKIAKAKQYAEEPGRVTFRTLEVDFDGDNGLHRVSLHEDHWHCSCDFFTTWQICCHTMAMERILEPMVKTKQGIPELASV